MTNSNQDQLIRSLFNEHADTYGKAYDDDHSPDGYFFRQRLKKIFALLTDKVFESK